MIKRSGSGLFPEEKQGVYKYIVFFVTFIPVFILVHTFKLKQLIQCDSREENDLCKKV